MEHPKSKMKRGRWKINNENWNMKIRMKNENEKWKMKRGT